MKSFGARKTAALVLALVTLVCVVALATAGAGVSSPGDEYGNSSGHQYKGHCGHKTC
jgi:hypothetical protein